MTSGESGIEHVIHGMSSKHRFGISFVNVLVCCDEAINERQRVLNPSPCRFLVKQSCSNVLPHDIANLYFEQIRRKNLITLKHEGTKT